MKKILMLAVLAIMAVSASAQKRVFCEIVGTQGLLSKKVTVTIDLGQKQSAFRWQGLVDENGEPMKFNSMVDAMNYMGSLGWEFEQAYSIGDAKSGYTYHFLLSKEVAEGEDSNEGLLTHQQFKDAQKTE